MNHTDNFMNKISVRGICVDILHNFWMIVLAIITVWCAATGLHHMTYQPVYTSSATLVIGVKGDSNIYSTLSMASQMAEVFGQVFQSGALQDKIAADVGDGVQGKIQCSLVSQTNLLMVQATSSKPRDAYLYLNSALANYQGVSEQIFSNAQLQIVQEPNVPLKPSNSSWLLRQRYLLMGVAGVGMAFLIGVCYATRFTVKTTKAAQHQLDGTIQGIVPFERRSRRVGRKRRKRAFLINSPEVSMHFSEAIRNIGTKVEYHMRKNGYKVLLVTSIGENEGKSTLAANLAISLAEKHKRVLLVDADLRKPALYKVFEAKGAKKDSFSYVLKNPCDWRDVVGYSQTNKLWIMYQFAPVANPGSIIRESQIKEFLIQCKEEMDYIILDSSPVFASADAEIWMAEADSVLMAVREDWADIRHINDCVDNIRQSNTDFSGFVLNAFHMDGKAASLQGRYTDYDGYSAGYRAYAQQKGAERWKN